MKIRRKHPVRVNHLGSDPIPQLVRRLALPAMLAQFVNVLYSIIDRMYIGNIANVGDIALAGVGICGPIVTMISAFAAWIGNGGAPLLSIKSGEQNKEGASVILANCFVLLIGMAVCLTIGAYLCKDALLVWFGATERIFPYAETYMRIYLIGTVFAVLSLGLNQFIICQGFSNLGMVSVIIGAILNILLDPLFIFALHMGVRGAAVATVLSQAASCAFSLYILFRGPVPVKITFHGYSFSVCSDVLTLGLTPFLIILFDNVLIIVQNVMLKNYGGTDSDMLLTCNTIVQSFMLIITMPLEWNLRRDTVGARLQLRRRRHRPHPPCREAYFKDGAAFLHHHVRICPVGCQCRHFRRIIYAKCRLQIYDGAFYPHLHALRHTACRTICAR